MAPLFGYGSLILPTSLISRFEDIETSIDDVYADRTSGTVRDDALGRWEQYRDRIVYLPAKISGFRRYYSLESDRGGTMLEVVRTDDPDDWINGVVVFGLNSEETGRIAESEAMYDRLTIRDPVLEPYVDPAQLAGIDADDLAEIEIFVRDGGIDEITATKPRNPIYHDRICAGIRILGEMYGEDIAEAFRDDFRDTTYETAYDSPDGCVFNTVSENDRIQGDTRWRHPP